MPLPLPDYDHAPRHFRHAHGHRQHYVDVGSGAPVLMLHGNPSWSYYYRRAINALKGTPGKGGAKPLATVSGTLWFGFILAVIFYIWFEIMRGGA